VPKGIKQAARFNWDTTAKQVIDVYESLVREG
jgi:glycosyltransferase involved in cell wall biosynthesis